MSSKSIIDRFNETNDKLPKAMKEFIKWLQKNAPSNIDNLIHELHDEVFEAVDCLECANCCKTVGPAITDVDIERLSKHLKIKPSKLIELHIEMDDEHDYIFKAHPCPFLLSDNYCSVYDSRPKACREYPHTDRRRSMQLLQLHKTNITFCPAVYEVFNRLKVKLGK
jgi:Fe-S-cluster containining protein